MAPIIKQQKIVMAVAIKILASIETVEEYIQPVDAPRAKVLKEQLYREYAECMAQMLELLPSGEEVVND